MKQHQRYQFILKSLPPGSFEIGCWLEMPQPLVENAACWFIDEHSRIIYIKSMILLLQANVKTNTELIDIHEEAEIGMVFRFYSSRWFLAFRSADYFEICKGCFGKINYHVMAISENSAKELCIH